jgi:inner membrane protein
MLTGACMSRAGLNRKSGLATALLVIAAEISDVDVLWNIKGPVAGLEHHRGWTHSFVGVPAMAALAVFTVWAWNRVLHPRRLGPDPPPGRRPRLPVRWRWLFALGCVGGLSHILLDYTTAYGIRFLEPFSYRWFDWDTVSIVEPTILIALVLGLVMPSLFALVREEVRARQPRFRGQGGAIAALAIMVLIWGVRDYEHRRAVAVLHARSYHGAEPLRASAYPYMWNPFVWHGVVETRDFFETMNLNSRTGEVNPDNTDRMYYKPEQTPVLLAAKKSRFGRVYLDWAAYPFNEQENVEPGDEYIVRFYDLRYRYAHTRRSPLSAAVVLDKNLRVIETRFGLRRVKQ